MKAWVLHGVDGLRWEEVGKPALRPDEVLVEVKAAGICGSDIPRIYRTGAHTHPLIPGHEFSGRVGAHTKYFARAPFIAGGGFFVGLVFCVCLEGGQGGDFPPDPLWDV